MIVSAQYKDTRSLYYAFLFGCALFNFYNACAQPSTKIQVKAVDDSTHFIAIATQNSCINSIVINGNKKTKNDIILRELTFTKGECLNEANLLTAIDSSQQNILNTGLFLTAEVQQYTNEFAQTSITITVAERWYVFPKPQFDIADRNINVWWVEQNHDLKRTEYGINLLQYNFTGNADKLETKAIFGFTQKLELFYTRPYITPKSNYGLGYFFSYSRNKQINYTTQNNKYLFIEDTQYVRTKFRTGIQLLHRKDIYQFHTLELKYNYNRIADTIAALNENYFLFKKQQLQFLTASYTYTSNHVDQRAYPLKGYWLKGEIKKIGLGIFEDVNQLTLYGQLNKYVQLKPRLFAAAQVAAKLNYGTQYPYFLLENFGYCENFVRGYEYYVIDGQHTFLMRSNIKTKFIDWTINNPITNWAVFEQIPIAAYLKLFVDAGYVVDRFYTSTNFLTNRLQYSAGIGLDVTTYYDWVFRFEYAVNALGQFGLYLHLALDLNTYEDCNLW